MLVHKQFITLYYALIIYSHTPFTSRSSLYTTGRRSAFLRAYTPRRSVTPGEDGPMRQHGKPGWHLLPAAGIVKWWCALDGNVYYGTVATFVVATLSVTLFGKSAGQQI